MSADQDSNGIFVDEEVLRLERCDLEALQLERLKWSLDHAYRNSRHYRAAFDQAGVRPEALNTIADIVRFPFTVKDDLRKSYPFGFFACPRNEVVRIHASSGTTGKPTVVGYTRADIETWSRLVARSIRAAGGRAGMEVHVAFGYGLFTGGLGAHYGAEALGCTVIPMSGGQTEKQVQLICDFAPDIIMATPSYMLAILDEFRRQKRDPTKTGLKIGIFGAEPWSDAMRAEIESSFAIDAIDIYGLSEVIGPGVASEFVQTKNGPTLWEDHFLAEVVDPATGEPLPDGEFGELVLTSLTKVATPIIRYRTRDLTRLLPNSHCAMRRIGRVSARSDDMLIIRGVNVYPSQIEEQILTMRELSPHYLLEITRPDRLDELSVIVEARSTPLPAIVAATLAKRIKDLIGVSAEVRIVAPGTLTRSSGKAQRVHDLRVAVTPA